MRLSLKCLCCQFCVAAIASLTCSSHAQNSDQPILVAHDVINGPTGGAHSVEVLTVFSNGTVTYSVQSKGHKLFTDKLKPADLSSLANLLDLQEIRELPIDLAAKMQSADFYWDQTLTIVRVGGAQAVQIEHFYPFLNLSGPVYPQKLIVLECKLQGICEQRADG